MSSTSSSRLAQVANERRRQRRQQAAANKAASDGNAYHATQANKAVSDDNAYNDTQCDLACAPTESLTFDDSTISSGSMTQLSGPSTIAGESFNFAIVPTTISSHSRNYSSNSNYVAKTPTTANAVNSKSSGFVSTPRRRNIYQSKLRSGAISSSPSSSTAPTPASLSSQIPPAKTPRKNNLSSNATYGVKTTPRNRLTTLRSTTLRNTKSAESTENANSNTSPDPISSPAAATSDTKTTPRGRIATPRSRLATPRSRLITPRNVKSAESAENANSQTSPDTTDASAAAEKEGQIRILTAERDKLLKEKEEKINILTAERDKLRKEVHNATLSAGEAANKMSQLEMKAEESTKELELTKSQLRCAELQSKESMEKQHYAIKRKDDVHTNQLEELEAKLHEKVEELSRMRTRNDRMNNEHRATKKKDAERTAQLEEDESATKRKDDLHANQLEEMEAMLNEKDEELSRMRTRNGILNNEHMAIKKKDAECTAQLEELERKLSERGDELSLSCTRYEELNRDKLTVEEKIQSAEMEWKRKFTEMKEERDEAEANWKTCLDQLDNVKMECEEKHAQREADLEKSLHDLQNEKRSAVASARRELSAAQTQLSNALADKRDLEKSLQDQISDLQNEFQMQRNSCDNVKRHHAVTVSGLKSDLAKARQLREESASSLQKDMETMKIEHDENMKYYKDESESLRSQLRNTKQRADDDRKEWMNIVQPSYDRKFQSINKEKEILAQQLAQANKDIECLKSVRDKDIQLLESELDKTYKSKVEMEVELKDTKRQLHNALRNLDEMMLDGGKMRCDLEGVMDEFAKEKTHYQNEIDQLQTCNIEQKCRIDDLSRENERCEENCNELRRSVQTLEDRCLKSEGKLRREMQNAQTLEDRLAKDEENCNELRRSVQTLEDRCLKSEVKLRRETQNAQTLEERLAKEIRANTRSDEEVAGKGVLSLEIQYLKNKLGKAEQEIASASELAASRQAKMESSSQSEISEHKAKITQLQSEKLQLHTQIAQHTESVESSRHTHRDTSMELSRAQQTIQILKSKERYLESRVESLANQISKTVQDYEMRLSISNSSSSDGNNCIGSDEAHRKIATVGSDFHNARAVPGKR